MGRPRTMEITSMNNQKGGYKCAALSVNYLTIIMEDYDYA